MVMPDFKSNWLTHLEKASWVNPPLSPVTARQVFHILAYTEAMYGAGRKDWFRDIWNRTKSSSCRRTVCGLFIKEYRSVNYGGILTSCEYKARMLYSIKMLYRGHTRVLRTFQFTFRWLFFRKFLKNANEAIEVDALFNTYYGQGFCRFCWRRCCWWIGRCQILILSLHSGFQNWTKSKLG